MFEWLGFANPIEWRTDNVFDQGVNFYGEFLIELLKVEVVCPSGLNEANRHGSISSRSVMLIPFL